MFGSSVSVKQVSYERYAHKSLACVQTSPISFIAIKEIGDVCTQANKSPIYVSLINVQVDPQSKTK